MFDSVKAFRDPRLHPLIVSILHTHDIGQSFSLPRATQGTGQDWAFQGSGVGRAVQHGGQQPAQEQGFCSLYLKKHKFPSIESLLGEGALNGMNHTAEKGVELLGRGVLVVDRILLGFLLTAVVLKET